VTITFNENVSGFAVGEIVVGNGSASNLAGGPAVYTANITPAGQGLVTVDVGAGVAQDAATNGNTAAPQFSITYDTVQPTVSITSGAPNPTNTSPIPVTITFSEPVGATFVVGEITVGNGAAGNFAGGPTVFTANITPAGQGAVTVDVNAGVAQDAATNGNTAAAQFSITYDTVPPTVSSSNRAGANPTNGATVTFTVTFSENVSGVDVTDFTPVMGGGVAGAAVQSVIGGPAAYTVTVSTGTGDGTLALDVADDDTIADAAGNRLGGTGLGNGAFTGGQAYTVDKTRPIVMNVVGQTANGVYTTGANIDIRITFSSNLTVDTTGGTPTLLLETGATDRTAAYTNQPAADTLEFRYTVVAGDSSTDLSYVDNASLAANGGTIRDGANNEAILTLSDPGLAGSLSFNSAIVIDATPPSVGAIASQSMLEDQASAAIAFTVTDLETALGSLTVTAVSDTQGLIPDANLSIANLGGGNRTITVTSPVANQNGGPVTITLTVTDQVGLTGNTTFQMTVTAVNDVPSFTAGANQSVAEDAGAQTAATWATAISRGPANEAAQAVDFIVTNDNNALFAAQPAVSAAGDLTYTPAANVNGSATVSVQIHDSGGTANGGVDTSAVQQFTITVTPVNDNPAVTLPSVPVTYLAVPAAPAAVIDANATVYDVDADGAIQQALQPDFNGGRLTVSVNGYNQPEDQTAIQTGGNITLNVANVLWTGIVIGTFSGGTNGTTPLQVDLNASATPAAVQDLARAIVFTNTAINPTNFGVNPSRAFDFVLTDGDGGTSATATQTVLITTVNQPPTIDLNGAAAGTGYTTTLSEGFGPVAIVDGAALTVSDPDELRLSGATIQITNLLDGAAESLSVTPSGGIAAGNISYDAATGVLAITANAVLADYQAVLRTAVYNNTAPVNNTTRNISFVVRDSANTSTAATCLVALNTRPRAGSGLVVRFPVMNAGETQGFTVDATDAENDALTYTFDFGDGTQSAPNLTDPAITHLYNDIPANAVQNADGTYTITASVTVTDHPAGVPGGSVTLTATFILGNPIQGNPIDDLDTFNPIPPMGIKSQGNSGVLRFDIVNCTNPVTSQMIPMGAVNSPLSTFLSPAAATFDGTRYFVKFKQPGIYLATATDANGNIARKMVPITVQEANNQPRVVQDIDISASFITGKFHFQSNRPDMVTFRGRFPLQNFTAGAHTLVIGIGNVVSSWTIDARGKGTLLSLRDATGNPRTDAQARLRFKGPRPTDSLNRAVLDLKVKMPDMDVGGFNSEGVTEAYGTAVTTPETVLDPMTSTLTKDPNTGEIVFVERTVNLEPGDLRPLAVQAVFLIDDTAAFAAKIRVGYAVRNGFGQLVGKSSKTGQ
jgi:hypothetical protein